MIRAAVLITILLSGCAGVGLVATSDPDEKIQQSYSLIAQDRALLAEDTIHQAMAIYQENKNQTGIAEAYYAYGNLYMSPSYHGKWAKKFTELGTYDGTYMKAINNFAKAEEGFGEVNSEIGVVKSKISTANAYVQREEIDSACDNYVEALSRYQAGKESGEITKEPQIFDKRFNNMGEIASAYIAHYKCRT